MLRGSKVKSQVIVVKVQVKFWVFYDAVKASPQSSTLWLLSDSSPGHVTRVITFEYSDWKFSRLHKQMTGIDSDIRAATVQCLFVPLSSTEWPFYFYVAS